MPAARRSGRRFGWVVVVVAVLASAGCGSDGDVEVGAGGDDGAAVVVLAKADGWRDGLQEATGRPHVLIEVAADRWTAERAWDDNVPEDLPDADGVPAVPGVHRSLESVDFERRLVVVFSSGESGTCPAWVSDISTTGGRVEVELRSTAEAGDACTDDYHPYRLVLAVERDALPPLDELPVERIDVPSENLTDVAGRVVPYVVARAVPDGSGTEDEGSEAGEGGCLSPSDFDREEARERARSLLGLPEDEVPESDTVRVARRGDEERALTMDLRPGRCNVELDHDGDEAFTVTRVVVEVPDGEEVVVE